MIIWPLAVQMTIKSKLDERNGISHVAVAYDNVLDSFYIDP